MGGRCHLHFDFICFPATILACFSPAFMIPYSYSNKQAIHTAFDVSPFQSSLLFHVCFWLMLSDLHRFLFFCPVVWYFPSLSIFTVLWFTISGINNKAESDLNFGIVVFHDLSDAGNLILWFSPCTSQHQTPSRPMHCWSPENAVNTYARERFQRSLYTSFGIETDLPSLPPPTCWHIECSTQHHLRTWSSIDLSFLIISL